MLMFPLLRKDVFFFSGARSVQGAWWCTASWRFVRGYFPCAGAMFLVLDQPLTLAYGGGCDVFFRLRLASISSFFSASPGWLPAATRPLRP